jgi:hypothetical protein
MYVRNTDEGKPSIATMKHEKGQLYIF